MSTTHLRGTPINLPSGRYLAHKDVADGRGYGLIRHDGVSRAAALSCAEHIGIDTDSAEWGTVCRDASGCRLPAECIGLPGQNWLCRIVRVD